MLQLSKCRNNLALNTYKESELRISGGIAFHTSAAVQLKDLLYISVRHCGNSIKSLGALVLREEISLRNLKALYNSQGRLVSSMLYTKHPTKYFLLAVILSQPSLVKYGVMCSSHLVRNIYLTHALKARCNFKVSSPVMSVRTVQQ